MTHRTTPTLASASPSPAATPLPPAVLRERDAAHYIQLSQAYLRKSRRFGTGPAFVRAKRTILYRVRDLDQFLEQHVVRCA